MAGDYSIEGQEMILDTGYWMLDAGCWMLERSTGTSTAIL